MTWQLPDFGTPWIASRPMSGFDQDKPVAEAMLRRLCLGAEIVAVYWDGFPGITKLMIADNDWVSAKRLPQFATYAKQRPPNEALLMIEHRWAVLANPPEASVDQEQAVAEALSEPATDLQLAELAMLHGDPIIEVRLGVGVGHLILLFDSGRCLFVHGDHGPYEAWEIRVMLPDGLNDPENKWLLVNTPGGDVCMWTPKDFDPNFDAEWRRPQE
ncbi:MAG TPA: hypothetical protein VJO13_10430 [Ktedonobacterales bacterium]|nr:hypothetical protein [Ktedonobacterales bacterium]